MKSQKSNFSPFSLIIFLIILIMGSRSYGQDTTVFFDCRDIGVEARRILSTLNEEILKIEKQQQLLNRREDELKILQLEVDKKLKRLTELREEMSELLVQKDELERDKIKKLSLIYQKRDPAGAAATLASMDKYLAVSILSMMRDKSAGKILDQMEKKIAVEYSTAMGRSNLLKLKEKSFETEFED
jgi:flagellar motility protein MotE (MotC chaperone)